jgi:hypothetical protein
MEEEKQQVGMFVRDGNDVVEAVPMGNCKITDYIISYVDDDFTESLPRHFHPCVVCTGVST